MWNICGDFTCARLSYTNEQTNDPVNLFFQINFGAQELKGNEKEIWKNGTQFHTQTYRFQCLRSPDKP